MSKTVLTSAKKDLSKPGFAGGGQSRPPIVAVMGHVDHGKTTLLDFIRKTRLAQKEPGQITQHIGAYQAEVETREGKKKITFIDTPGHKAFTQMRARGAQVTDIVILVVAADDGVMPQTKEAIEHIRKADVPFLVAINKIDLPTASPEKVKKQLAEAGVLLEGMGGDIVSVPISAKTGQGVEEVLEMVLLMAEMQELKADPGGPLKLSVVEAKLDKLRGPVATVIVQNGTLRTGDMIELSGVKSKVRAMFGASGKAVKEALPSMPVEILGLEKLPQVGEIVEIEEASSVEEKKLKIILKADTAGSLEAVTGSISPQVDIVEKGVGEINESDILSAKTRGAQVLGFNAGLSKGVEKLAETEKIKVKTYRIIYELLEDLEKTLLDASRQQVEKEVLGRAKILSEFPYEKTKIAGCQVQEGRLGRGDYVKILRGETEIGESRIKTLRIFKETVTKVEAGKECGVLLDPQLDFIAEDAIIAYRY